MSPKRDDAEHVIRRAELADARQLHVLIKQHAGFERGQADPLCGWPRENCFCRKARRPAEILVASKQGLPAGLRCPHIRFSRFGAGKNGRTLIACSYAKMHVGGRSAQPCLRMRKTLPVFPAQTGSKVRRRNGILAGFAFYRREGASIIGKACFHFSLKSPFDCSPTAAALVHAYPRRSSASDCLVNGGPCSKAALCRMAG